MTLHMFNPEHDLALASGLNNFTAPHAARELRAGLGFLPALWAKDGDSILVEDRGYAQKAYRRLMVDIEDWKSIGKKTVIFIGKNDPCPLIVDDVDVWGWDAAVKTCLTRYGVESGLMPGTKELDRIKEFSHRASAAFLRLRLLKIKGTVGESMPVYDLDTVKEALNTKRPFVLKAPWSSSGRGIRFVEGTLNPHQTGWIRNMLSTQHCVMLEPYYKKVKDFGMEFVSDGQGKVCYLGLSLFHTVNGAYAGNILATEKTKISMISRYVSADLLNRIKATVCEVMAAVYCGKYKGPFGVDMMIVANEEKDGFLVHPCVEINLRRTMGHVALCLSPTDDEVKKVMRITAGTNYLLNITPL